ncbi:hypothetical protein GCM10007939_18560 [Amylibacter marinus]|uniref:Lipoprotein SmpA/OmlA domain-containing protein n=1 Tax=Amylibacter marinus TaxID=1475483 RepID=A0ABQ5VVV2_9RHOB|nr:hypothetical protein [Amylibacter marinus]GLQ35573.1 hypothetical protein GCM10007939_18560 [Amylibacter marinus]
MYKILAFISAGFCVACAQLPDSVILVEEPELLQPETDIASVLGAGATRAEVQAYLGQPLDISKISDDKFHIYKADEIRIYADANSRHHEYHISYLAGQLVSWWHIES